ncbi:PIN domain-containing protein [Candidatus Woesearchaeota archaeon]|nr:PIN domain-containing protein [Candidatus Woesearchaeota archaeon]
MIFLDSWIWIEFFAEGKKFERCKEILESVQSGREKAMINALNITEIKYRLGKINEELAHEQVHIIETFPNLVIVPVVLPVASLAADLRKKYFSKERRVSYADMIHLATAILANCTVLYSGDPDFEGIEEMKTTVI